MLYYAGEIGNSLHTQPLYALSIDAQNQLFDEKLRLGMAWTLHEFLLRSCWYF